jgi:hypothetical protein|tara:strand:- start:177 stop:383 length:207 start_codon:yes stop_codon:yes gene_type:complete
MRYFYCSFQATSKDGTVGFGSYSWESASYCNHTALRKELYKESGYSLEKVVILNIMELTKEDYEAFVA